MIYYPYLLQVSCQSNIIQPGNLKVLDNSLGFHGCKLFKELQTSMAEMVLWAVLLVSRLRRSEASWAQWMFSARSSAVVMAG